MTRGTRARRRAALTTALAAGLAIALAPAAEAHGIVGRKDVPIPEWLFGWGAAVVLIISFVALAVLWPRPRLEQAVERPAFTIPRVLDPLAGLIGVAMFGGLVYAGFSGTQGPTANILPTFIYVVFWVGLVPLSALLGDVFRPLNPWRAVARFCAWIGGRVAGGLPAPLAYPERLGRWPAAAGVLGFAVLELAIVPATRDDPSILATLALAYAAVQLIGMALYGIETWTDRGDAFSVYFGLFARVAPLHTIDRVVHRRAPVAGVAKLEYLPGTAALLFAMIGSTAFDGGAEGPLWTGVAPDIQQRFLDIGFSLDTALELTFGVGLLIAVLAIGGLFRLGVTGMRTLRGAPAINELSRRFIHSLVPIALAYVVAHYFSLLAYQGQALGYLISDPLGQGNDFFGTHGSTIDYSVLTATTIWYVQVGVLVVGHVAGLILAHDRALMIFKAPREATRSQYWMLVVMVGFTSLGLWLLSASNG